MSIRLHSVRLAAAIVGLLGLSVSARADLDDDLRAILKDKLLQKGEAGVEIVRLGHSDSQPDARVVFRHNSDLPLIPASNLKLVTTSAALDMLGKDFKFRTVLARRGNDLAIIGDGDPTLGDAELLKQVGWGTVTVFKNWADVLKGGGVKQVDRVLVDDSVFDQEFFHPNWPLNQENRRYVAQIGGLNLNANCLDFFVRPGNRGDVVGYITDPPTKYATIKNRCLSGSENAIILTRGRGTNEIDLLGQTDVNNITPVSVTIHDPPMFAGTVLAETLESSGIRVGQAGRDAAAPNPSGRDAVSRDVTIRSSIQSGVPTTQPAWQVLAIHETPLDVVLARANKDSMNQYAEALYKRLGHAASGKPGSWANGHFAVGDFLTRTVGVSSEQYTLDDGCGLSKKNAISANALAQVLRYDFTSPNKDVLFASLAVAGVDGTFENRFKGTSLQHRVFGKSGYVSGVSSLSGYLWAKDGQWYAFAIILNGVPEGMNSGAKALQEKIVRTVDAYAGGGVTQSPARPQREEKVDAK